MDETDIVYQALRLEAGQTEETDIDIILLLYYYTDIQH